jgi:hypothetical protein
MILKFPQGNDSCLRLSKLNITPKYYYNKTDTQPQNAGFKFDKVLYVPPPHISLRICYALYLFILYSPPTCKTSSKKYRNFARKTLSLILQHFKHCPLQSSLSKAQWYITYVSFDGAMHPRVYKVCSKKDRTFVIRTLLLILQYFKHCPLQSNPLYWRYTVPNVSSIVGMLPGTHFLFWREVLTSHFPESPLCHKSDEQLVHVLSSADVARRLMLIAKRDKWQFVAKT